MKVTKYEHSCLDISEGNTRLIVDPGVFSKSLTDFQNINAVIVTHVHTDHFDPEKLNAIIGANSGVKIYTTSEVQQQLNNPVVTVVNEGSVQQIGDIQLEFFGKDHALIDKNIPLIQNVGVLINGKLYYPGDSWTECNKPHEWLGMPTHAPWLKHSDAMDFLRQSQAKSFFQMHNTFLNQDGLDLYDRILSGAAKATNKTYRFLKVGESLEI